MDSSDHIMDIFIRQCRPVCRPPSHVDNTVCIRVYARVRSTAALAFTPQLRADCYCCVSGSFTRLSQTSNAPLSLLVFISWSGRRLAIRVPRG